MDKNLELDFINQIMLYTTILRERGFAIKLKFWNKCPIELDGVDAMLLKNAFYNSFYNVFEKLLSEDVNFNKFDLEAFGLLFGVSVSEFVEFLNNFIEVASRVLSKKERSILDDVDVKSIYIDMERFRMNMLNYILQALMAMSQKLYDGIVDREIEEKYDNIFVIDSLLLGGR